MEHTNHSTGSAKTDGFFLAILMFGSYISHLTMDMAISGITGIGAVFYAINQIMLFISNRRNRRKQP